MERTLSVHKIGGGIPESIHREDEKHETRMVLERSTDDEVYVEFYKPRDDVNLDESNKSNNP
jgi:hypothetical protein